MTAAVRLHGVRVEVAGRLLLDVPALDIGTGERVAIVGPNGAGKSTLLKLLGGLMPPSRGRVEVLGRALAPARLAPAERQALRAETGLLMQGLHLVPRLSALENVAVGALSRLRGAQALRSLLRWYPPEMVAEARDALAALGLADHADARTDRLSGGERQKVALARLQLQRPRLLLADEPTSALDPAATAGVCRALLALAATPGRTLVTVVHDVDLLPLLSERVLGVAAGKVLWDRPVRKVADADLRALYAAPTARVGATEALSPPAAAPARTSPG